jgi:hypothetical protein
MQVAVVAVAVQPLAVALEEQAAEVTAALVARLEHLARQILAVAVVAVVLTHQQVASEVLELSF